MTSSEAPSVLRRFRRRFGAHSSRATSHTRALAGALFLAVATGLVGACDRNGQSAGEGAAQADSAAPQARIEALRQAFAPISPTATSDKKTAWREAKRERLAELERGPASLARHALELFRTEAGADDEWRSALLSVAAHTDRELARPLLESLSLKYDGKSSLGVRNEAMRLLCKTSPASAAKLFEPILLDARPSVTYPPKEQMLQHWTRAARSIRQPVAEVLATIATDLAQSPDVRYVAVDELAQERDSELGHKALETVLVESGSDGLLRRKAAQSLRDALSRAEACAILERVAERESDQAFLLFLADMLNKNCP